MNTFYNITIISQSGVAYVVIISTYTVPVMDGRLPAKGD
jgi:hypothetical protein